MMTVPGSTQGHRAVAGAPSAPEPDIYDLIARNLLRLRTERGLSLLELSARSNVAYWTLQEAELGRELPSIEVLWKIARVLGVSCDAFIEPMPSTKAPGGPTRDGNSSLS
jgi:transcriptional regulator with XRE-family HTH domain